MQVPLNIYVRLDQAQRLEGEPNKSEIVRDALDLYFKQKDGAEADGERRQAERRQPSGD